MGAVLQKMPRGQTRRVDVRCGTGAGIGGVERDRRPRPTISFWISWYRRNCGIPDGAKPRLAAASMQCRMTAPDA
jgi:hypothetical protein